MLIPVFDVQEKDTVDERPVTDRRLTSFRTLVGMDASLRLEDGTISSMFNTLSVRFLCGAILQ